MSKADETRAWTAAEMPSQMGRRILITGANSGIGFHAALKLARRGSGSGYWLAATGRRGEIALAPVCNTEAPSTHTELAGFSILLRWIQCEIPPHAGAQ